MAAARSAQYTLTTKRTVERGAVKKKKRDGDRKRNREQDNLVYGKVHAHRAQIREAANYMQLDYNLDFRKYYRTPLVLN